ncbi:MAG TPA: pilus assembly PilX N-terminal domain-containing protein [Steroidobacteraceae bacterium]|nr:pilus assembly PilX N-terminal domain-containing protein [Steroidobacteraceae bacterium]
MSAMDSHISQRGAALVVGLLLLLVVTILAVSGITTAMLEMQMAGNRQFQERAFQAAEAGIEQAMASAIYNTNQTRGNYDGIGTVNPEPIRGQGIPIADCPEPANASDEEQCEFFVRFDDQSGSTPVPGGGYSLGTGFEAYHFVVDSFGSAERGAASSHEQSFYIVGPGGT